MRADEDKEHVAFHEAAHAVADVRGGLQSGGVSIEPDALSLGRALSEDWCDANTAGAYVLSLYAGLAVELELGLDPDQARLGASRDLEEARRICDWLGDRDEQSWLERARSFVRQPENMKAIERVTAELLDHGFLRPDELELIIEAADGVEGAVPALAMLRSMMARHR